MMILITLLGVALRTFAALNPQPFWYDEAFSGILARLPLDRLLAATAADVHPPLYYMALRVWLLMPWARALPIEAAARALSLVFSLIGLALFYALIRDTPPKPRRVAWALACLAPGLIYYAGEARMYALLSCFILGALLLLTRNWQAATSPWYGLACGFGAGVLCLGAALTHNAGLLYCVVVAGAALLWRKENWPLVMIAGGAALCGWVVLWGPTFVAQLHATENYWIWQPNLGTAVYMFYRAMFPSTMIPEWAAVPLLFALSYVTTWAFITRWPKRAWLWLAVGVPVLAYIAAHLGATSALMHRILVPSLYAWCVLWAFALTREDVGKVLTALTAVALISVNGLMLWRGRLDTTEPLLDALHAQPGDVIYSANTMSVPLVLHGDMPMYIAPEGLSDYVGSGLSAETIAAIGVTVAPLDGVDFGRAWLIWLRDVTGPTPEDAAVERLLASHDHVKAAELSTAGDSLKGDLWLLKP